MKYKLILFVVALIALLAFQAKIVMPIVYDIIASDLFLEDSGDEKSRVSTNSQMTDSAYKQCNIFARNQITTEDSVTFSESPINAFSLGNFQYIINADIDISPTDGASFTRRYVCRIKYLNDGDSTGISDFNNWSIEGLSGLDNL